jgi:hypothetical protein
MKQTKEQIVPQLPLGVGSSLRRVKSKAPALQNLLPLQGWSLASTATVESMTNYEL